MALAACAGPYEPPADVSPDGQAGGRSRVLIPQLQTGPQVPERAAQQVAETLRAQVAELPTHTSVPLREMRHAMRHFEVRDLDRIQAIQLADLMNAQAVTWGEVREEGGQLVADVVLIDVQTQAEFPVSQARGADPAALGADLSAQFESTIEGLRMAYFCQEDLASERWEEALRTCNQALEVVPESDMAQYGVGAALFRLDRFEEALTELEQVIERNPDHEDALLTAGLAASRLDQRQQATEYYRRYMELRPEEAAVRIAVAHEIAGAGDPVSAYRILEPVSDQQGDDIDFLEYFGRVATAAGQDALERGEEAEARQYFADALDALETVYDARGDDLDAATIRQIVAVYRETGREGEALEFAERATRTHGDDAAIWQMYGQELARVNRNREAVAAFTRAINLDPELNQIHLRRAIARIDAGERQAAREDLAEAARRGDREQVARFVMSRGLNAYQADNFDDSITLLSMAQDYATPQLTSEIRFWLGMSHFRLGQRIAEANNQGRAEPARQALGRFRQALPHFRASNHQNASQMASSTEQFIDNQEAIIRAAQRGR